jgi:hypothetical protein
VVAVVGASDWWLLLSERVIVVEVVSGSDWWLLSLEPVIGGYCCQSRKRRQQVTVNSVISE